ncbi:T9SS type A sorting domain-containing protein [Flavobacteriales bacterium]|nr:T9SS type A sorting domain-containing protein [Flavobacteriales bacterium]
MKSLIYIICIFSLSNVIGQGIYAPAVGNIGTTAIHKDSSIIVSWGSKCKVIRGPQKIDSLSFGLASNGDSTNAIGKADGTTVSLGDRGEAIFTLYQSIHNGPGADFTVFENGFSSNFLELAFVEVSSDGIHFFRFPSFSNTQDTLQVGTFGGLDATHIHNLAGKYQVNYGTPFDLDEIPTDSLLNKWDITHIKIIDAVGNILPEFASYDSQGRVINDPWPTPFSSSGFDLDALGLIHVNGINNIEEKTKIINIYPNPFNDKIIIDIDEEITSIQIISLSGVVINLENIKSLNLNYLSSGIYFINIKTKTNFYVKKMVKK